MSSGSSSDMERQCDTCGKLVPISFMREETGTCMFCFQIGLEYEMAKSSGRTQLFDAFSASNKRVNELLGLKMVIEASNAPADNAASLPKRAKVVPEKKNTVVETKKKEPKIVTNDVTMDKEQILTRVLGSTDAVRYDAHLKHYVYKCTEPGCHFVGQHLERHLLVHVSEFDAKRTTNIRKTQYKYIINNSKAGRRKAYPCIYCPEVPTNISSHLKKHVGTHPELDDAEQRNVISEQCRVLGENLIYGSLKSRNMVGGKKIPQPLPVLPVDREYFKKAKVLTQKEKLAIKKENVKLLGEEVLHYDNACDLLDDFEDYQIRANLIKPNQAKTNKVQITRVWKAIDKEMSVFPVNHLGDFDRVQCRFFNQNLTALSDFNCMERLEQDEHIKEHGRPLQASSLNSHLLIILNLLETIHKKNIYCGMRNERFAIFKSNSGEIVKQLNRAITERKVQYREMKSRNVLTKEQLKCWGKSTWVKNITNTLKQLHEDHESVYVTPLLATSIRDHIMFLLTLTSGLRSSNLMELTIKDLIAVTDDEHIVDHKLMANEKYKTSYVYGTKYISLCPTKYTMLKIYETILRPLLIEDGLQNNQETRNPRKRFLFVSQDALPERAMKQSVISKCVKRALLRGLDDNEISKQQANMVSPSLIRASVATMLHRAGKIDNLEHFCNSFMKHNPKTGLKHYILEGAATEKVLQYTMDIVDVFGLGDETNEDIKMLSKEFEKVADCKHDLQAGVSARLSTISTETGATYQDKKLISHINAANSLNDAVDFTLQPQLVLTQAEVPNEGGEEEEEDIEWDGAQSFKVCKPGDIYVFRTLHNRFDRRHVLVLSHIIRYIIVGSEHISKGQMQRCFTNCEGEQIPYIALFLANMEKTMGIIKAIHRKFHANPANEVLYNNFKKEGKAVIDLYRKSLR